MKEKITRLLNNINVLMAIYFFISFIEIIAELYASNLYIYVFKTMLIPALSLLYWKCSKVKSVLVFSALFFALLANIYFVSKEFNSIFIAVIFFALYRLIVIYIVVTRIKMKSYFPIFLGCIPFAAVFIYITMLTMNQQGNGLYIYIMQATFMTFLGGFSLAAYMIDKNKMNYWLLLSSLFFAIIQIVLIIKIYYLSVSIFQPFLMILYVVAQFALIKFILLSENEKIKVISNPK